MAKKKGPQKECPGCQKLVAAATGTCPHCEHKFSRKERGQRISNGTGTGGAGKLKEVLEFLEKYGSPEKLVKKLGRLKQDELLVFTSKHGGIDKTIAIIEAVGRVQSEIG
jgi:hypothetical protein